MYILRFQFKFVDVTTETASTETEPGNYYIYNRIRNNRF